MTALTMLIAHWRRPRVSVVDRINAYVRASEQNPDNTADDEPELEECPLCGGSGQIGRYATWRRDPQTVVYETCPKCHGDGVVP